MLLSLHVKNFAIIDEAEVDFKDNLNILTGETGAGKSILIGSINAALGGKVSKGMIRTGADYALVELVFETKEEAIKEQLKALDISIEENQIVISRKLMESGRSVCRINGESTTTAIVKEIASQLLDIHGQHEHQSLLYKQKHLAIVDRYAKEKTEHRKAEIAALYREYTKVKKELEESVMDEEKRLRELSFLEYEINEIKAAELKIGEDEELQAAYRKLSNAKQITSGLTEVYQYTAQGNDSAADILSRAVRMMLKTSEYDENLTSLSSQIEEIESLLNDFNRDIAEYMDNLEDLGEDFVKTEERLDLINHLKQKYGGSIKDIFQYEKEAEIKLERLTDYEAYTAKLKQELEQLEEKLEIMSLDLSEIRKKEAKKLTKEMKKALIDLNFLDVKFEMIFERTTGYTANGFDIAEFIISTNPGEPLQPLSKVASGGELSRIMLAIKSVLAEKDEIGTLIFDEIDVGVSGRTAQKVSEKLAVIAKCHQVLCITHLPQIAAMADAHYLIEKVTDQKITKTKILPLSKEDSIQELARILGGAKITESVLVNAKEMKELAQHVKNTIREKEK